MNQIKRHWKALVVVSALALGIIWYTRPMDIYGLTGMTLKDPDEIAFLLYQYDGHVPGNVMEVYSGTYTPESPEWDAMREVLRSLRFRRPPWNLLLQFLDEDETVITGRRTGDGIRLILLWNQDGGGAEIQFFSDEWRYGSSWSNRDLPLWMKNGGETGDALAEALGPLVNKRHPNVSHETTTGPAGP